MYQMPYSNVQRSSVPNMQGLAPEYGDELFTNLQAKAKAAGNAGRQQVMDNTSRFPGMAGPQQGMLRMVQRDTADQALQTSTGAALQGVQEGLTDRRTAQRMQFEGQQGDLNRGVQTMGIQTQDKLARDQMNAQQQWAILQSILGSVGSVAGAGMGAYMSRPPTR